MPIRISVITATLNRRPFLERALESVASQRDADVEHIVVDAMSSDGTDELLAAYPHLVVLREPDSGVYEAWNKGLRLASGDLICFLNSDDEIPVGAFERVRNALTCNPGAEIVSGAVELCSTDASGETTVRVIDDPRIVSLREQDIGPGIPITNARYLTKDLVRRIGWFDERYRLVSDRDYLLRVVLTKPNHARVKGCVYRYHAHAGSLTLAGAAARDGLARESLRAAGLGLDEAARPDLRAAYRRWHAWAVLYKSALDARRGDMLSAARTVGAGFGRDPLWPMRIASPLWLHWHERMARRGHRPG